MKLPILKNTYTPRRFTRASQVSRLQRNAEEVRKSSFQNKEKENESRSFTM